MEIDKPLSKDEVKKLVESNSIAAERNFKRYRKDWVDLLLLCMAVFFLVGIFCLGLVKHTLFF